MAYIEIIQTNDVKINYKHLDTIYKEKSHKKQIFKKCSG